MAFIRHHVYESGGWGPMERMVLEALQVQHRVQTLAVQS